MSKRILIVAIFLVVVLICVKVVIDYNNSELPVNDNANDITYSAKTEKTYFYVEGMTEPTVDVIRSVEELGFYKVKFEADNLIQYLDTFNQVFFENNTLAIISIQESSTSNNNTVVGAQKIGEDTLKFIVQRDVPEIGDTAMAMNHIVVQLKNSEIEAINNFIVGK